MTFFVGKTREESCSRFFSPLHSVVPNEFFTEETLRRKMLGENYLWHKVYVIGPESFFLLPHKHGQKKQVFPSLSSCSTQLQNLIAECEEDPLMKWIWGFPSSIALFTVENVTLLKQVFLSVGVIFNKKGSVFALNGCFITLNAQRDFFISWDSIF